VGPHEDRACAITRLRYLILSDFDTLELIYNWGCQMSSKAPSETEAAALATDDGAVAVAIAGVARDDSVGSDSIVRTVALGLRAWAIEKNLLKVGGSPMAGAAAASYGIAPVSLGGNAADLLERQAITGFGMNSARNTVFIYTSKRITMKDKAVLPNSISAGVRIEFRQARPIVIGPDTGDSLFSILPFSLQGHSYTCGSSISIANDRSAGTLGCLVRDRGGDIFGLSNNHVTGGCNNARTGLPIAAPGILDVMVGGFDPFTVGHHYCVLPMRPGDPSSVDHRGNSDAALFQIRDEMLVSSMQGAFYDTPAVVAAPVPEMSVEKVGRTTGRQIGVIEGEFIGPMPVSYRSTTWHSPSDSSAFVGTVYFEPVYMIRGMAGAFSLPGDSGSLVTTILDDGTRAAVGLIFAGREPNESYMLPLEPVMERLGVTLVSGHNVR
jgi:hypothetical protein